MSMKNPMTLAGIEPATFRFVAQHLNHCATAVPTVYIYIKFFAFPAQYDTTTCLSSTLWHNYLSFQHNMTNYLPFQHNLTHLLAFPAQYDTTTCLSSTLWHNYLPFPHIMAQLLAFTAQYDKLLAFPA
jgi:hypothetical protein